LAADSIVDPHDMVTESADNSRGGMEFVVVGRDRLILDRDRGNGLKRSSLIRTYPERLPFIDNPKVKLSRMVRPKPEPKAVAAIDHKSEFELAAAG
jgi:hypothetical protein